MNAIQPYIPRENSINDAVLCYLSSERAVLDEMRGRVVRWAKSHLGPDWHTIVRDDPNLWGMDGWDQPEDAFYILKCIAQIPMSKISHVFGHPKDIGPKAKPVFLARNRWSHFSNQLVMSTITKEISQLRDFALVAGLEIAQEVDEALLRLGSLASTPAASPSASRSRPTATEVQDDAPVRPRIGEPWLDELPTQVWEISDKLHDVKAKADGQSLKSLWEDKAEGEFAIARLFHLDLSPKVLYVDPSDGATVGFREGHPYLVGYAGSAPKLAPNEYQGFFDERAFDFTGEDLLVSETGDLAFATWDGRRELIRELVQKDVSEEDEILLTDFGDVVAISERGARRVCGVEPEVLQAFWQIR